MISDVALGQFFPGKSVLHKIDPRVKLILTVLQFTAIFMANKFLTLAVVSLQVFCVVLASRIHLKVYFKSLKAIFMLVLFTTIINLFYGSGEPLISFWIFKITKEGISNSVFVAMRVINLILISSVLTFTTSPTDLTDALERLMKPLKFLKINVHEIAMMMTIALRFVPTLLEEANKIMNAQKARGADLESGKLLQRVKSLVPILIPLFVSSFHRAYDLAMAMECRCYQSGGERTRMKVLKIKEIDILAVILTLITITLTFIINSMNLNKF